MKLKGVLLLLGQRIQKLREILLALIVEVTVKIEKIHLNLKGNRRAKTNIPKIY